MIIRTIQDIRVKAKNTSDPMIADDKKRPFRIPKDQQSTLPKKPDMESPSCTRARALRISAYEPNGSAIFTCHNADVLIIGIPVNGATFLLQTGLQHGQHCLAGDRVRCRRWNFKSDCVCLGLGEDGHTFNEPDAVKYLLRLMSLI